MHIRRSRPRRGSRDRRRAPSARATPRPSLPNEPCRELACREPLSDERPLGANEEHLPGRPPAPSSAPRSRRAVRGSDPRRAQPISSPSWLNSGVAIVIVGFPVSDDMRMGSTTATLELASSKYRTCFCAAPSSAGLPSTAAPGRPGRGCGTPRRRGRLTTRSMSRGSYHAPARRILPEVPARAVPREPLQSRITTRLRASDQPAHEDDVSPLVVARAIEGAALLLRWRRQGGRRPTVRACCARATYASTLTAATISPRQDEERADQPDHERAPRQP